MKQLNGHVVRDTLNSIKGFHEITRVMDWLLIQFNDIHT